MSENVRVVQSLGSLLGGEDLIVRMTDEALLQEGIAALEAACWPDFEFVLIGPDPAFRAEFRGVDGFVEGWHDWLSPFETYRIEPGEIIDGGDHVVALGHMKGKPKGTSGMIENDAASVFSFEDGKVRRMEFHLDRGQAMRSAGLDPANLQS